MTFKIASSPHHHSKAKTSRLMQLVLLACVPGLIVQSYFFGFGVLIQLALAIPTALLTEALVLRWRGKSVTNRLQDYSAVVTAVLLAAAIPAYAPWWIIVLGTAFAIMLVKQLYGGLGQNPFNPAMAAYVMLLISFPVQMSSWLAPVSQQTTPLNLSGAVCTVFSGYSCDGYSLAQLREQADGTSSATVLDSLRNGTNRGQTVSEIKQQLHVSDWGSFGWNYVNLAFLLGGLLLWQQRVIQWRIPVAVLGSLTLVSGIFWLSAPAQYASPLLHLFSGGTMLAAFFIATDPVSASTTATGRLIYGALIGSLAVLIRNVGGYPDGWAFGVMLANMAVPLIDAYTKPRTYGHQSGRY